jgi:hypothetical protein
VGAGVLMAAACTQAAAGRPAHREPVRARALAPLPPEGAWKRLVPVPEPMLVAQARGQAREQMEAVTPQPGMPELVMADPVTPEGVPVAEPASLERLAWEPHDVRHRPEWARLALAAGLVVVLGRRSRSRLPGQAQSSAALRRARSHRGGSSPSS